MLTGSVVSSIQGEPRTTHDIDVVVDLPPARMDDLLQEFPPPDFYLSRDAIDQAIRQRSMFNLLDVRQGDNVDFWLLTPEAFDHSRFARRRSIEFEGLSLPVSAPEDTILAKLRWFRDAGGSERQYRDALRVYEVQGRTLDMAYLDEWVDDSCCGPNGSDFVAKPDHFEAIVR